MADKEKEITIEDLPEPISDQDMLLHNIIDGTPDISDLEPNSRQEIYLKYIALNGGTGGGGGSSVDVVQTTGESEEAVMSQKAVTEEIEKLGTAAYFNTGTDEGDVPVLNSIGKLDNSVIPSLAITDTFVAENEEEMLNLQGAERGDICIRTDENKTYILDENPKKYSRSKARTTLSDWVELQTPTDEVQSVNGQKGNVVLSAGDVDAYTKEEVDGKVPTIVQTRGTSENDLMSQKAVSNNMLLGDNVKTTGISNVISIGNNSKCYGNYCVTIGDTATCGDSFSKYAVAIGKNSTSYNYSVALGSYSKTEEQSVVSVGDGSTSTYYGKRRIINVKDPVNSQDAATKNYVDNKVAEAGSGVNVVQETGESEEDVMSQKAVTDSLSTKVDAVEGKGLSTEDFTTEEKEKLASIPDEIPEVNIVQTIGTSTTSVMSQNAVSNNTCFGSGASNNSSTYNSAFGANSKSTNEYTSAFGYNSVATGSGGSAFGYNSKASGNISSAFGYNSQATTSSSSAFGRNSVASTGYSVALGAYSTTPSASVISVGDGSTNANYGTRRIVNVKDPENEQDAATKKYVDDKVAEAGGSDVTIVQETGTSETDVMSQKAVSNNTCFGYLASDEGSNNVTIGRDSSSKGSSNISIGSGATTNSGNNDDEYADDCISIGTSSSVTKFGGTSIGGYTSCTGDRSVALGYGSKATEDWVVSVSSPNSAQKRRIVQVGDPVNDQDAATKIYVDTKVAEAGGGSSVTVVQETGNSTTSVMSQNAITHMYDNKIPIGGNATASELGDIAIGFLSKSGNPDHANGVNDCCIAIGYNAKTTNTHGISIGSSAATSSESSISLGSNAKAQAISSISIGTGAQVTGQRSVALGASSKATEDNVVSVGNPELEGYLYSTRRIVNVKDPVNAQDAATKNYADSRVVIYTATILANAWLHQSVSVDHSYYMQEISLSGILATDNPLISVITDNISSSETVQSSKLQLSEFSKICQITTNANTLVAKCFTPTTVDLNIRLVCFR